MRARDRRLLGQFTCSSGTLVVSDLCYLERPETRAHAMAFGDVACGLWQTAIETVVDQVVLLEAWVREPITWHGVEPDLLADTPIHVIVDRDFALTELVNCHAQIAEQVLGAARACVVPGGVASVDCASISRTEVWLDLVG